MSTKSPKNFRPEISRKFRGQISTLTNTQENDFMSSTYWTQDQIRTWLTEQQELGRQVYTSRQINEELKANGISYPGWLAHYRVERGIFRLPFELIQGVTAGQTEAVTEVTAEMKDKILAPFQAPELVPVQAPAPAPAVELEEIPEGAFIPEVDPNYVQFGHHSKIQKIIKSGIFFPTFITGLSGNGKTHMVEQTCAKLSRECVRVNITVETDEMDLIGGFRLLNGATVWEHGPVVHAMKRGAVLLLDEVDLASNKIMCLQSVLEGKGVFIKKINEWVTPADGFQVFATANTKGRGDDTGKFMGANILNEAFLERFAITCEQNYPTKVTENKILLPNLPQGNEDFADKLTDWSQMIRKTYEDGGVDDIITTRRLIFICKTFTIFGKRDEAIQLCLDRFDEETKVAFWDLYRMLDETANVSDEQTEETQETEESQ